MEWKKESTIGWECKSIWPKFIHFRHSLCNILSPLALPTPRLPLNFKKAFVNLIYFLVFLFYIFGNFFSENYHKLNLNSHKASYEFNYNDLAMKAQQNTERKSFLLLFKFVVFFGSIFYHVFICWITLFWQRPMWGRGESESFVMRMETCGISIYHSH